MPNSTPFSPENTNYIENEPDGNSNSSSEEEQKMPKIQVVNTILNYSKALSIRKTEKNGFIENILN